MRLLVTVLAAVVGGLLAAAPASAALVYVKTVDGKPTIFAAQDDGSEPRELVDGTQPQISPDGGTVAYLKTAEGQRTRLALVPVAGGDERVLTASRLIESVAFSPDSKLVAAEVGGRRLDLFEVDTGRMATLARGSIKGLSFSPDSDQIAYGLGVDATARGAADVYRVSVLGGKPRRLTRDGRSLLPVWGPQRIAFVKQKGTDRSGRIPTYDIWKMSPRGREVRRVTSTKVPDGVSGLLPIEWSADGRRLIAQYVGAEVRVGFTVNPNDGRTRSLRSKVAFDLASDGSAVLTQSGGIDPEKRHNIYAAPYARGKSTLLVRNASFPDWSR
jgi:Tol biopolymer transport system component